jgi:hypothetical protein
MFYAELQIQRKKKAAKHLPLSFFELVHMPPSKGVTELCRSALEGCIKYSVTLF